MKRTLLFAINFFLGGIFGFAQCDEIVKGKYDEFDKITEYKDEFRLRKDDFFKTTLNIDFFYPNDRNYLTIFGAVTIGDGTNKSFYKVTDGAYLHFLFEDGTDLKLYKIKGGEQESLSMHTWIHKNTTEKEVEELRNKESEFLKLKTLRLKAIRLASGYTGVKYDFSLTESDKSRFQKLLDCLNFL